MGTAEAGRALLWVAAALACLRAGEVFLRDLSRRLVRTPTPEKGALDSEPRPSDGPSVRSVVLLEHATAWVGALAVAALVASTACLGWSFVRVDASLLEVANASQRGRPFLERLAGLWGASRPSLLLWTTLVVICVSVPIRRRAAPPVAPVRFVPDEMASTAFGPDPFRLVPNEPVDPEDRALVPELRRGRIGHEARTEARTERAQGVLVAALCGLVAVVHPFRHLAIPAIDGRGLQPILRHPAMSIHPPLLYLTQALIIAGALRPSRLRLHGALAAGAAALTLGGAWAFSELGWGGFGAWDPVENAGLMPWLALLAAVHVGSSRLRMRATMVQLAGVLALAGAALTRSGRGVSVHSFAPDHAVGIVLWALVAAGTAAATWSWIRARTGMQEGVPAAGHQQPGHQRRDRPGDGPAKTRAAAPAVMIGVLIVVALGTFTPLVATRRVVTGVYFARATAPLALVLLALLIAKRPRSARVAHLGALFLAIGVVGAMFGRDARAWLHPRQSARLAGYQVRLGDVTASTNPSGNARARQVRAPLTVDGQAVVPRADEWTGWEDPLAETESVAIGATNVQVVLRQVIQPEGTPPAALIEVHARPLLWFVWIGGALLTIGSVTAGRQRQRAGRPKSLGTGDHHGTRAPTRAEGGAAGEAAVHDDALPIDVTARTGHKEQGGLGDVDRQARAAQR